MILQACSACGRQYDVAHLRPGDRVRCVCDAVLSVQPPKQLTVRARKCANCGGKAQPDDAHCSYCGAELSRLDQVSTLCPGCYARIEDDSNHCKACGVEIAPQALTPIPDGRRCPRCEGELRIRALGATSVVECAACEGLWLDRAAFETVCKRAQERPEVALEGRPVEQPVRAAEPERRVFYIKCVTCGEEMLRKMFRYKNLPSRVVIDYCRLHGVWFDADELRAIIAFIQKHVDVEVPFDMRDALGTERRPPSGSVVRMPIGRGPSDFGDVLAGYLVAEAIGEVFGSILGSLFD